MKWILIMAVWGSTGVPSIVAEFSSRETCVLAMDDYIARVQRFSKHYAVIANCYAK